MTTTARTTPAPATTRGPAVEIHDLHKSFGTTRALDGLDLTVRAGEVAGFLGPNGAGKSTTIRVLLGLLRPDSGTATLLGGDPFRDAVSLHRRLAYVPGDVTLWPQLSGGETIDLLLRLRGAGVDERRKARMLERFELDPTKKTGTYSKGNRQKVALVAALSADAELLVLDEPTSGLDPIMESVFQDCVREATARGTSVLLSSHILAEVEALCDTVTIIRGGRAVQSGTLRELRHLTRSKVVVTVGPGAPSTAALAALEGVHDLTVDGSHLTFHVDDDALPHVTRALADLEPHGLTIEPPSLEELFLRQYGDELALLEGEDGR
ncbi:ABC transporter ATP-binding protein [Oerskovia sp. Root918]|uniref:ABC transporter ATP-binding protein n=1 Tax=unclassified Oerskovia TaxID=2619021 RepID=UPI0006FE865B|nr:MULTISPECIES: ABC transporter ATP-binding protein [unclassified Oerskovia]KRC42757.1 ABC transporter ATP-binding protein [Oerskovia sp. Root22]KRD47109.1 ABC transporter ATP-binding protein [Oerskovia sp. Root918]